MLACSKHQVAIWSRYSPCSGPGQGAFHRRRSWPGTGPGPVSTLPASSSEVGSTTRAITRSRNMSSPRPSTPGGVNTLANASNSSRESVPTRARRPRPDGHGAGSHRTGPPRRDATQTFHWRRRLDTELQDALSRLSSSSRAARAAHRVRLPYAPSPRAPRSADGPAHTRRSAPPSPPRPSGPS